MRSVKDVATVIPVEYADRIVILLCELQELSIPAQTYAVVMLTESLGCIRKIHCDVDTYIIYQIEMRQAFTASRLCRRTFA